MVIGYFRARLPGLNSRHGHVWHAGRREEAMVFPVADRRIYNPDNKAGWAVQPPDCLEPDYEIVATASEEAPRFGCGWKISDTEDLLYLDDPVLPAPILARLIHYDANGYSDLVWDRYAELSYPKGFL